MVHINKEDHDNPHGLPKDDSEGSQDNVHHDYALIDSLPKMPEEIEKLEYIYQHFQDHDKVYESDLQVTTEPIHDTLYPQINNNIEYRLFENVIIVIILIVRLRMISNVLILVIHMTPQQVQCIQTHPAHTHMITFHNNLTP